MHINIEYYRVDDGPLKEIESSHLQNKSFCCAYHLKINAHGSTRKKIFAQHREIERFGTAFGSTKVTQAPNNYTMHPINPANALNKHPNPIKNAIKAPNPYTNPMCPPAIASANKQFIIYQAAIASSRVTIAMCAVTMGACASAMASCADTMKTCADTMKTCASTMRTRAFAIASCAFTMTACIFAMTAFRPTIAASSPAMKTTIII